MSDYSVRDISAGYGGAPVISGFSHDFSAPGAYALMGASGSGKTTLLRVLGRLMPPLGGELNDFAAARTAMLFQENRLLPWRTILQNAALAGDEAQARRWLTALGLADKLDCRPRELSGGQCRRAALARCMVRGGDFLLLDEPFSGLDEHLKERTAALLRENFPRIILATHDPWEAELFAAEVIGIG